MKDESNQIAILRTKYVIVSSDICRYMIKEYSSKTNQSTTLKTLADIIHLDQIPKVDCTCNFFSYILLVVIHQSLTVIGGGTLGLSVASCMKELGCDQVTIIERQLHCLVDITDIDREIAAYIESTLVKQQIDIITKCAVNHLTETAVYSTSDPIKFVASSNIDEHVRSILELVIDLWLLVLDEY